MEPGASSGRRSAAPENQVRIVLATAVSSTRVAPRYEGVAGTRRSAGAPRDETEEIIAVVKASGLRGRGGAGFPTGTKWSFRRLAEERRQIRRLQRRRGGPGAFMDRSVLEGILIRSSRA